MSLYFQNLNLLMNIINYIMRSNNNDCIKYFISEKTLYVSINDDQLAHVAGGPGWNKPNPLPPIVL